MQPSDILALDEMIHPRFRLGIMAQLANEGSSDFMTLKRVLGTTQGNLSVHLRKLEEAGYLTLERKLEGRRTRTQVALSRKGEAAFAAYIEALGRMIAPGA